MASRRTKENWSVKGVLFAPFVDRRKGGDRRANASAEENAKFADRRHGERRKLVGTALLWMSALFVASAPAQAGEKVSFEATRAYTTSVEGVQLRADISKPDGAGPFPAVVLMHGCGGWQPAVRHAMNAYADYLVAHGFVVLALDSFGPRNLGGGKVCESIKSQRDALDYRTQDALDALKYLRSLDYVDGRNVFLMGQSNGGSVAINVAKGDYRGAAKPEGDEGYRAVAAYYPWCGSFGGRKVTLEAPLMVFAGAMDDWTPASECEGVQSTKAELEVTKYPDATHSFDLDIMPQKYLGKSLGYDKAAAEDSRARMLAFFVKHATGQDWKTTRLARGGAAAQAQP